VSASLQLNLDWLPFTIIPDRPLSDAAFQELCFDNASAQIERTRNGEIRIFPPSASATSDANSEIIFQLRAWWHTHRQGMALGSSAGFFLADGSMLCPNAAYVSAGKVNGLSRSEREGIPHVCPDFVIELLSRWEILEELQNKMTLWTGNGAALAWLINPDECVVTVYRPGEQPVLVNANTVQGTGLVDGFVLNLDEVWQCYRL
jgi:Uma2 family endonuclease